MFRVKRVNLQLRNDVRTADIYEKSTVRLAGVGLAQARPNKHPNVLLIRREVLRLHIVAKNCTVLRSIETDKKHQCCGSMITKMTFC